MIISKIVKSHLDFKVLAERHNFSSENMTEIALNTLQGSEVTQNVLGGSVIYRPFANFL